MARPRCQPLTQAIGNWQWAIGNDYGNDSTAEAEEIGEDLRRPVVLVLVHRTRTRSFSLPLSFDVSPARLPQVRLGSAEGGFTCSRGVLSLSKGALRGLGTAFIRRGAAQPLAFASR